MCGSVFFRCVDADDDSKGEDRNLDDGEQEEEEQEAFESFFAKIKNLTRQKF